MLPLEPSSENFSREPIRLREIGTARFDSLKPAILRAQTSLLSGGISVEKAVQSERGVDWMSWARHCMPRVLKNAGPKPQFEPSAYKDNGLPDTTYWRYWTQDIVFLHVERDGSISVSEGHYIPPREELETLHRAKFPRIWSKENPSEVARRDAEGVYSQMMSGLRHFDFYAEKTGFLNLPPGTPAWRDAERRARELQEKDFPNQLEKWIRSSLSYGFVPKVPNRKEEEKGLNGTQVWARRMERIKCPLPKNTKFDRVVLELPFSMNGGPWANAENDLAFPSIFQGFAQEMNGKEKSR